MKDEISILLAEDARKRAHNAKNIAWSKQLHEIVKRIDRAASNGEYSLVLSGTLYAISKDQLEKAGYRVTEAGDVRPYIEIRWDD